MRVTLDWDDAPALASNFAEAVRGLTGDPSVWDLAASANADSLRPAEVLDAGNGGDTDADTAEAVQTALDAFEDAQDADPETLRRVADRLDLDSLPDGSHFTGYGNRLSIDGMLNLRGAFGDDGRRLDLDRNRVERGSPHLQLLFDRKHISRREDPANKAEDGPTWTTGRPAAYVAGTNITDVEERVKDPETGRLDYPKIIEMLAEHPDFGSRAALFRRIQDRGSVDVSTRPSARGYDLVNERDDREPTRAEKKALRDYAEDRDLGHYSGGRARRTVYTDELPEGVAARERRALVEYVDVVWSDKDSEDRGPEDDYFRELNVTTSTLNENNTNRQVKVTHDHSVRHAMECLNPTGRGGVTLEHQRERAANVDQADGQPPIGEMGETTRNPDSLNWEHRQIDADEAERYLGNLPVDTVAEADRAETNPIVEVTLYGEDPVNDPPIWHVIVLDDGDRLSQGTIIKDSMGWW